MKVELTKAESVLLRAATTLIMDALHTGGVNPFEDSDPKARFYYELLLLLSKHQDKYDLDYKFEEVQDGE